MRPCKSLVSIVIAALEAAIQGPRTKAFQLAALDGRATPGHDVRVKVYACQQKLSVESKKGRGERNKHLGFTLADLSEQLCARHMPDVTAKG